MTHAERVAAFDRLRARYLRFLTAVLWKLSGDRELFAEAMQYALLGLWRHVEKLEGGKAGSYIYRIALSANAKAWRQRIGRNGDIAARPTEYESRPVEAVRQAAKIRGGGDENYEQSRGMLRRLPWWLTRAVLDASDYLVNELHLDLSSQGMPLDPFGSAMVTNVGMFGIDTAFAPFLPIARCPMLVLVPQIRDRPWVVDGRVESRPVLRLCATFDHRIIDGFQAGKLSSTVAELLTTPDRLGT